MRKVIGSLILLIGLSGIVVADTDSEIKEQVKQLATARGITDKAQLEALYQQVSSTIRLRNRLSYKAIKNPCKEDLLEYCSGLGDFTESLKCIKINRDRVSTSCENALSIQLGGKPLRDRLNFNGILFPKGSYFLYDSKLNVVGIVASSNFNHKGIMFKAGRVSFNLEGRISVAKLENDQFIDEIKISADGLGPFFNMDGSIANATLAENTKIAGVSYKGGTSIMFHSRGKVKSGTILEDTTIDSKKLVAGEYIQLNKDGAILSY